ncbi:aldehyde dehydrogenase [Dacryopinax primogenitus]|uniref:Aldehyde dehydrogenase n=1 Tax=Dacryopinax primogenitus (strain DJM 731) TaxID=1858805 RepID=M5FRJ8_DACPD|nr:aldehyde dehydrogenase [Dacryopinax primogenitus]EJT97619.1 aldehyde dehydrogenase [Dacryopinax primogenitus]
MASAGTNGTNGVSGHAPLPAYKETPIDEIPQIHADLVKSFRTAIMWPLAKRKEQLAAMANMMKENADAWSRAIYADLGKPELQAQLFEIAISNQAVNAIHELEEWTAPIKPDVHERHSEWQPTVYKIPFGVVLIISPWNYPLTLTMQPLVAALAAGNCVVLKPSELAPNVSALMAELVPKYFDPRVVRLVNGGVKETTRLLELKWDRIFYTGNGTVGRIIAQAAAKHLTPVTLELGGKSPVVIDPEGLDFTLVAKRILHGKLANAGQTCVAPDYILCPEASQKPLMQAMTAAMSEFFEETGGKALNNRHYGRIVNKRHFKRIKNLVDKSKGEVVFGEKQTDPERYAMEPLVIKTTGDDDLMGEEIFGPVFPLITIKDVDDAINFIEDRDHPLSLYVFTKSEETKQKFVSRTRSGGIVFNDTMEQLAVGLPFGGIGESGMGYTVGRAGFESMMHLRASVDIPYEHEEAVSLRYPPYTQEKVDIARMIAQPHVPEVAL